MKRYLFNLINVTMLSLLITSCSPTSTQDSSTTETSTEYQSSTELKTTPYEFQKVEIVTGDTTKEDTTWMIGEDASAMIFTADGSSEKVSRLKMDGVQMYKNAYTLGEDVLTITLQSAYLDRMKVGEHTLTIVYEDGEASITFVVEEKEIETEEFIITDEMLQNKEHNLESIKNDVIIRGYETYYVVEETNSIYYKSNPPLTIYLSERNHTFRIFLGTYSSSTPMGTYEKTDTELILHEYISMHVGPFVFDIEGDTIKFNAEKSSDYFNWEDGKTFYENHIPQDQIVPVDSSNYFDITLPEGISLKQAPRANEEYGTIQWLFESDRVNIDVTLENAWISAGWIEINMQSLYYIHPNYLALGCESYDFTSYDFGEIGTCEFDVSTISDEKETSKFWAINNHLTWIFLNQEYFTEEEAIQVGESFQLKEE